jgi:hypothetical protein
MHIMSIIDEQLFKNERSQGIELTFKHKNEREVTLTVFTKDAGTDDPSLNISINQNEPVITVLVDDSECIAPKAYIGDTLPVKAIATLTFNLCTVLLIMTDETITIDVLESYGTEQVEKLNSTVIEINNFFNTMVSY